MGDLTGDDVRRMAGDMLAWRRGLGERSPEFKALLEYHDLGALPVLTMCRGGAREGDPDAMLAGLKRSHWILMAGTTMHYQIAHAVSHLLGALHMLQTSDSDDRKRLAQIVKEEVLALEGTRGNRLMADEHGETGVKRHLAVLGNRSQAQWTQLSHAADDMTATREVSQRHLRIAAPVEVQAHDVIETKLSPARTAFMAALFERYRVVPRLDAGIPGAPEQPIGGGGRTGLDGETLLEAGAYESMCQRGREQFRDIFKTVYINGGKAPMARMVRKKFGFPPSPSAPTAGPAPAAGPASAE